MPLFTQIKPLLWYLVCILGQLVQGHSSTDCWGPDPIWGQWPLPHSPALGMSLFSQGGHPKLLMLIFCDLLELKGLHCRSLKQSFSSTRLGICGLCPGVFWPKKSLRCAGSLCWKTRYFYRTQFSQLAPEMHPGFVKRGTNLLQRRVQYEHSMYETGMIKSKTRKYISWQARYT